MVCRAQPTIFRISYLVKRISWSVSRVLLWSELTKKSNIKEQNAKIHIKMQKGEMRRGWIKYVGQILPIRLRLRLRSGQALPLRGAHDDRLGMRSGLVGWSPPYIANSQSRLFRCYYGRDGRERQEENANLKEQNAKIHIKMQNQNVQSGFLPAQEWPRTKLRQEPIWGGASRKRRRAGDG